MKYPSKQKVCNLWNYSVVHMLNDIFDMLKRYTDQLRRLQLTQSLFLLSGSMSHAVSLYLTNVEFSMLKVNVLVIVHLPDEPN